MIIILYWIVSRLWAQASMDIQQISSYELRKLYMMLLLSMLQLLHVLLLVALLLLQATVYCFPTYIYGSTDRYCRMAVVDILIAIYGTHQWHIVIACSSCCLQDLQ